MTDSISLYEISGELLAAIDRYNSVETDEELAQAEKELTAIDLQFKDKAVAVGKFITGVERTEEAIEQEIARLVQRRDVLRNRREKLTGYLLAQMLATGNAEIKSPVLTLKVKKNPPSVDIVDETKIPEKYKRVIPEQKAPDKKAILAAHKQGIGVEGAMVVEDKVHLEIK